MTDRPAQTFEEFVLGQSTTLLRVGYLLTGDRHVAEDLLQGVLERMYVRWGRISSDPLAYARRAMVNAVMLAERTYGVTDPSRVYALLLTPAGKEIVDGGQLDPKATLPIANGCPAGEASRSRSSRPRCAGVPAAAPGLRGDLGRARPRRHDAGRGDPPRSRTGNRHPAPLIHRLWAASSRL